MIKYIFLLFFLSFTLMSISQKFYCIANLTGEFSGISFTDDHVKGEFRSSIPKINGTWTVDFIYQTKKIIHKISFGESVLQKNFRVINAFMAPPNNNQQGIVEMTFGTGIDYLMVSYNIQKEGKKEKNFILHSKIRFNYSLGLGYGFNRSKAYYEDSYVNSEGGRQDDWTYMAYEAIHYRDGFGLFLKGTGGFDFINKRKRRVLCFSVFYNQGLKQMAHFDIHYQYGFINDPQKQVNVTNQILRSRGTTFGFNVGVPITIIK